MLTAVIETNKVAGIAHRGSPASIAPWADGTPGTEAGLFDVLVKGENQKPDPRQVRLEAQEALELARKIAHSRELPPGWNPATPLNVTSLAEQELRSQGEQGEAEAEGAMACQRAPGVRGGMQSRPGVEDGRVKENGARREVAPGEHPTGATAGVRPFDQKAGLPPPASAKTPTSEPKNVSASASSNPPGPHRVGQVAGVVRASPGARSTPGTLGLQLFTSSRGVGERRAAAPAPRTHQPREVVAGQVLKGFALALNKAGGKVTLRLNPEHLGHVVVSVHSREGKISARIEPSEASAHRLLVSSLENLKAALEARGLSVERVDIMPPPPEANGSWQSRQEARGDGDRRRQANRAVESSGSVGAEGVPLYLPVPVGAETEDGRVIDAVA